VSVTGAILVGGDSVRMGRDKATLEWQGRPLLHHVHDLIAPLCREVLVVTRPGRLLDMPVGARIVHDAIAERGPLVGIHAALTAATDPRVLVVAVDMPWLASALLSAMIAADGADVVIPRTDHGWEPLHAVYHRRCRPAIENVLSRGPNRVSAFFDDVDVDPWDTERCRLHDPSGRSFLDLNRPENIPK